MQLTIHRGTRTIGGSCVELESGNTRLIVDVGLPLIDDDREPFDHRAMEGKQLSQLVAEGYVPAVSGLFTPGTPPDGILLSHAHMDHVGLLHLTPETVPVYASSGTSKMMNAGSMFSRQQELPRNRHVRLRSERQVSIGDFQVTPIAVDHSSFGSMAFLVESAGKRLLYSGDLRMHGRKPGMMRSLVDAVHPLNVDALVMEGTHLGRTEENAEQSDERKQKRQTEYDLEKELTKHIRTAPGLVLGSFSPQDLDRLVSYLKATMRSGRTFVVDAYGAYIFHLLKNEVKVPDPCDPEAPFQVYFNKAFERRRIRKLESMFAPNRIELAEVLAQPGKYAMMFRPSMLRLDFENKLPNETRCLYSSWQGHLTRPDWVQVRNDLASAAGELIPIHTSGHIYPLDHEALVESLNPKKVIPIHTLGPGEFVTRFPNTVVLFDGEAYQV